MARVKSRAMILAMVFVATTLVTTGAAMTREPGAAVAVVAASDTLDMGRVNHLQVAVANLQESPLRPLFSVQSDGYPFYWTATEGPVEVAPGETRLVDLVPRSTRAMLLPGLVEPGSGEGRSRPFVVRVNDVDSSRYWVSEPADVPLALPPIASPEFLAWSDERDPHSGLRAPIGWSPEARRSGADRVDIRQGTRGGVELEVTRGATAPDDWTEVALSQTIWRASCPTVDLEVPEFPQYATADGIGPALAAGIQVRDEAAPPGGPYAWVVLDRRGTEPYRLASGTLVWPVSGEAGRYRVRLAELFIALGQPEPTRLNLQLFLAAHRQAPGTHRLLVDAFRCAPRPPLVALSTSGAGIVLPFGDAVMFSYSNGSSRTAPSEQKRVNQANGGGNERAKPEKKPEPKAPPKSEPKAPPKSEPKAQPRPQTKQ